MDNFLAKLSGTVPFFLAHPVEWVQSLPPTRLVFLLLTILPIIFSLDILFARNMPLTKAHTSPQAPPPDWKGDIKIDDKLPTKDELAKAAELEVFDKDKRPYKFKDLLRSEDGSPRRTLLIFIRHFFCGNCQEYTSVVSSAIPPSTLASLATTTSIKIIGCGTPVLIQNYIDMTSCPYPIYADPISRLYKTLRMGRSLALGKRHPQYMQHTSIAKLSLRSVWQELTSGRNILRGGDFAQVGGEFLFEPSDLVQDGKQQLHVSWCKRMKNTRDHAEVSELRRVLGLDSDIQEQSDDDDLKALDAGQKKRWSVTTATTGLSRRLSTRAKKRMSWHAGAANMNGAALPKSPSEKEAEQERQVLEQLKEDNEVEGQGTQDDALKKLTGTVESQPSAQEKADVASTTSPTEQMTNGHAVEGQSNSRTALRNGEALEDRTNDRPTEDQLNGATPEHKLNGHADKDLLNGSAGDMTARAKQNGHAVESKTDDVANGTAVNGSAHAGLATGNVVA